MTSDQSGPDQLNSWAALAVPAMTAAVEHLCTLFSQPPATAELATGQIKVVDAGKLVTRDEDYVTVALTITGDANAMMLLLFTHEAALQLVDLALGDPTGTATDIDEMAISVLGEAGNTMGGAVVSSLGNTTGRYLWMSVPAVRTQRVGAVVDQAVQSLVDDEYAVVSSAVYQVGYEMIEGSFVIFASPMITQPQEMAA